MLFPTVDALTGNITAWRQPVRQLLYIAFCISS